MPPDGAADARPLQASTKTAIKSTHFIQASVFATVFRTMYMYEQPDTLGRKVGGASTRPQLLVVPRAGWLANAYYERALAQPPVLLVRAESKIVHTSLSRDIVAHETAHALIDGIVPDLYDAYDPQSLALHEGIADLTAVLIAFRSDKLRTRGPEQDRWLDREIERRSARSARSSAGRSTRPARSAGCAT